jgi:phenylacetate-CoA ligase
MLSGVLPHPSALSDGWLEQARGHPLLLPPEVRARNGGERLLAMLAECAMNERMPAPDLAARQREWLRALARHAAKQSPHFEKRLKAAGLTPDELAAPGGLQALPPLTRRQLVSARESLFCRSVPREHGQVDSASTTGSTGEPVTVRRTQHFSLHWLALTLREHLWHRRDFSGRLAIVRANVFTEQDAPDWGAPCSLVFRTGRSATRPFKYSIEDLVRWLSEFSPHYLLALPSTLIEIIAELERTGRRLPNMRGVRTLSETVTPHLREEVWRLLGVEVQDVYSSMEGGLIATQCPEQGNYHVSEQVILEVVDEAGQPCAPGQTGRILLTQLVNYATPLIRYEIGDYAEVAEPCACGRGLTPIKRFVGRQRNLVLLPDGSRHWPVCGFASWGAVFPVRQFQFIQPDRQTIIARFVASGRPTAEQESRLTAIIQKGLGHPFNIRYEWLTQPIPRGPGGKFEEFICRAT